MRHFTTSLLLLCALPVAAATEIWRWVDANGVVHFSDQRVPGAERVTIDARTGAPVAVAAPAPRAPERPASSTARPEPPFRYTQCSIALPEADQTLNFGEPAVVSLDVRPRLRDGHRVRAQLNGDAVAGWATGSLGHTLNDLPRGSYTIAVQITSNDGRVQCTAQPVTFHVRQSSLLSPGRRQAPRS